MKIKKAFSHLLIITILFGALFGCVAPEERLQQQQQAAYQHDLESLKSNSSSWKRGAYYRAVYSLRQKYDQIQDAYEEAFWRNVFVAADSFDQGQINQAKFDAIWANLAAELHERQERDAARYMPVPIIY